MAYFIIPRKKLLDLTIYQMTSTQLALVISLCEPGDPAIDILVEQYAVATRLPDDDFTAYDFSDDERIMRQSDLEEAIFELLYQ